MAQVVGSLPPVWKLMASAMAIAGNKDVYLSVVSL